MPGAGAREYSERTAAVIDDEVQALLQAARARARETLTARRSALEALGTLRE